MAVFVEDWGANYGSAYLVTQDDAGSATAELVEDGLHLLAHDGRRLNAGYHAQILYRPSVMRLKCNM